MAITKHENSTTASRGYVITNAVSDEPIKVGDWVYCYENGQREQGSYFEDQKEGVWTEWHDNGYEIGFNGLPLVVHFEVACTVK